MKKIKRFMIVGAAVTLLGALSITAYAATPSGITENESINLQEYKQEMLQNKKDILEKRVEAGLITQERADAIIKAIEENQLNCDGSQDRIGQKMGAGFGSMNGRGQGLGAGQGMGGFGKCGGTCQVQ